MPSALMGPLTLYNDMFVRIICSLNGNEMEAKGAASLAEALKVNTTLQSIRCASKSKVLAFAHKR